MWRCYMYINPNEYNLEECSLTLTYKGTKIKTYFDLEDFELISKYHWRIAVKKNKYYVCTGQASRTKLVYMQNLILGFIPDKIHEVDHIDGESLNNRKSNLRLITRLENIQNAKAKCTNKLGFRGVNPSQGKYCTSITVNKVRYFFKGYNTLEEAVYLRYLCEKHFLPHRYIDDKMIEIVNSLDTNKKEEIESYFKSKIDK